MSKFMTRLVLISIFTLAIVAPQAASAREQTIPMLREVKQTSPNQLLITYDQPVDKTKGITPTNYWIQSTTDVTPTGIATLGKNDQVNPSNSLTASKVSIAAADSQNQSFVLTFNQNISKGKSYKMIICYVTTPGAPPFTGDNGSATFIGQ
ncbi:hypothetical protein AB4Z50_10650 [Paenibacillus sp. 2TAB26]|uniref:hypothetical protein n=1 Tax=Paenibacillus sp. 2TAB26 TaxID=3233005 RepID=UPI003F9535ED